MTARDRTLMEAWRLIALLDMPLFVVGGLAAITGRRWGAYLLLANLAFQVGGHLTVATLAYREVMRRPWPAVRPLDDDDW